MKGDGKYVSGALKAEPSEDRKNWNELVSVNFSRGFFLVSFRNWVRVCFSKELRNTGREFERDIQETLVAIVNLFQ